MTERVDNLLLLLRVMWNIDDFFGIKRRDKNNNKIGYNRFMSHETMLFEHYSINNSNKNHYT